MPPGNHVYYYLEKSTARALKPTFPQDQLTLTAERIHLHLQSHLEKALIYAVGLPTISSDKYLAVFKHLDRFGAWEGTLVVQPTPAGLQYLAEHRTDCFGEAPGREPKGTPRAPGCPN